MTSSSLRIALVLAMCTSACSLRSLDGLTGGEPPDPVVPPPDAAVAMDAASPDRPPADGPAAERTTPPPDVARPSDVASDTATAPPDAGAEAPPSRGRAFLVVANVPPMGSDALLQQRLAGLGMEVVPVDDDKLANLDTNTVALILISQSSATGTVAMRFRSVPRPVVVCEPLLFDDMGMVTAMPSSNRGTSSNVTALRIDLPSSPLAGGLTGMVTISTAPGLIAWGIPVDTALKVASVAGTPADLAVFAYDTGVMMAGIPAPARRVGLFVTSDLPATLSPAGWTLFDAAVSWAIGF
jgi:hypothetical protein